VGVRELVRQRILRLYVTGEVRQTRVGHGLDSSMDWIGLDCVGLDWVVVVFPKTEAPSSSVFFR